MPLEHATKHDVTITDLKWLRGINDSCSGSLTA